MNAFKLKVASPVAQYLDELAGAEALADRPSSLDGKVIGLIPNWRPAAIPILRAMGDLLGERFRLKGVVMEPPVHEALNQKGKLLDRIKDQLDEFARRVDVAIIGTGD